MPESTGGWEWYRDAIRYYINAISHSSGKRATFNPSTNIQVGDYGVIGVETNEFQRCGNIFRDEEILRKIPELATDEAWKPRTSEEEDKLVITDDMEMTDFGPNEGANLRLQFKGGPMNNSFLVISQPSFVDIPQPIDLVKLRKIEKLAKMHLVTGVVTCPAYALFYTGLATPYYTVNVSLNSGINLGKEAWTWEGDLLRYKEGYNPQGDQAYTPLFSLTNIQDIPDDGKNASGPTVPTVDPIKPRLPIPAPSAGDGNELFTSGVIGAPPWLTKRSKRPENWKNRPSAPDGNSADQGESTHMDKLSVPEPLSTTAINSSTQLTQASGAADQTRLYYSRRPENDSDGCFPCCCCQ